MPRLLKPVIYLRPPRGPALVFTDNETWLGRNSLELSEKAQLLCSRKQACLKTTDTAVTLECHGLNPIYFVVCHSADFEAREDTPPYMLHQLRRGESVELVDGDKFFLVPKECLLTVGITSKLVPDESTSAVQLTPDAALINTHDERTFPEHGCWPKATQQGPALTSSPVGQHGPLQTGALSSPLLVEVRVNFAGTCFTRSVSPRDPAVHDSVLRPPENSFKSSGVIIPRSCLGACLVEDSQVRQVESSTKAPNADPTLREVVIDRGRSIGASKSISVADDCHTPEFSRLDLSGAGDSLNTTLEVARAAGTSLDGNGCGSSNAAPKPILVQSFQTSSPVCPGPEQVQGDKPSAAISDPRQDNLLPRHLSPQHRNSRADSRPESGPGPASPPLDSVPNGLPIHDGRQMHPKQPEIVHLTRFENERDAQAQFEVQSLEVEHAVGSNKGTGPIESMKNVVVTISGYEDLLRARLINLITVSGASYTGSLTKVNTHVVCWKFRGPKYEMAKKLGKIIVNHCWFEDCQKAGRRLSEEPYKASGEMAEALQWDQSSSLQHPSSSAGFDRDQNCNSLLSGEHSQGQVLVIGGPSTHSSKRAERFCRSDLSSRNEIDMLDRGKRQVDLNSSTNRLQGDNPRTVAHNSEDARQMRTLTISGDSPPVDLSALHPAPEQESDAFWNEVIRAHDDRNNQVESDVFRNDVIRVEDHMNNQVTEQSWQVVPIANHRAGLMVREPVPELNVEIRSGRRPAIANEADPSSGLAQGQLLQEGMPSSVREQSDNAHSEVEHSSSNPEVFQRKRQHAVAVGQVKYLKFKRRRLPKPGDPPGRRLPSYVEYAPIRGPPTSNNGSAQESVVDAEDGGQQSANVINAESAGKAAEKSGESASSSEITCVICHADTKPTTEGVLACGHQFCFPCIQRWADEAKSKSPTCPLCKVPFDFITFRKMDKAGADVLEERIVQIGHQRLDEPRIDLPSLRTENLCVMCGSIDTPELLLVCTHCRERAIHTFCLDPPCPPGSSWSCSRCSQMHSRTQIREIYGRLFQGVSLAQQRQGTPEAMIPTPPSWSISRARPLLRPPMPRIPSGGNLTPQSGSTSIVGGLAGGQSSATPPQRRRQTPLDNFLVRQNDG